MFQQICCYFHSKYCKSNWRTATEYETVSNHVISATPVPFMKKSGKCRADIWTFDMFIINNNTQICIIRIVSSPMFIGCPWIDIKIKLDICKSSVSTTRPKLYVGNIQYGTIACIYQCLLKLYLGSIQPFKSLCYLFPLVHVNQVEPLDCSCIVVLCKLPDTWGGSPRLGGIRCSIVSCHPCKLVVYPLRARGQALAS